MTIFKVKMNDTMRILVLFASLAFLGSCVPNRKYVYLQKNDVNSKVLPKDTVVREYSYEDFAYKIQPEDILSVRFESLTPQQYDFFTKDIQLAGQSLSQQANPLLIGELVDNEGMVPFPVVGKVKVAGLTIYEAQDTLQKIANQYLQNPIVKVRLINFRITFLGEVNREGTITLSNNRVSLMEAIGLAGGLTDLADKKNIKLIRIRNGQTDVQYIDLLDEDFMQSPNFFINQNDLIIVPALRQRPYRKYVGQNVSLAISALTLVVLTINLLTN
ncbi:polysaccharide export protein [Chryseotalea sanaruensis]|uniref:Polysaccharide export protein n=2 Tax=Chryseotalea sanaruensis TaxID=2482724 RepID=A0A401U6X0_9BACT|nr:polysaccharide export protein [Chryseotalea sanaruensis]